MIHSDKDFLNKQIDAHTYEFCEKNHIANLSGIREFLLKEKPAFGKSEKDQIGPVYELYKYVLKSFQIPVNYNDVRMSDVLEAENASVRCKNVCKMSMAF